MPQQIEIYSLVLRLLTDCPCCIQITLVIEWYHPNFI